jgi:hypothetical protein
VEHLFITEVLKGMNLPVNFITWVGILYKNINSKVQVNIENKLSKMTLSGPAPV